MFCQQYSNAGFPMEPGWLQSRGQISTKKVGNLWVSFTSPTGRDTSVSRGDLPWGQVIFCRTGLETTRARCRPINKSETRGSLAKKKDNVFA